VSEFGAVVDEAEILAQRCFPILAGHPPLVQGAALAELVARHLAGHVLLGDPKQTEAMRTRLLVEFVRVVKDLIPILDEGVIQPQIKARTQ
jgi:hypothetical protein